MNRELEGFRNLLKGPHLVYRRALAIYGRSAGVWLAVIRLHTHHKMSLFPLGTILANCLQTRVPRVR